jgi:predicted pyridoxine 5'-phosphate oxidase superfamily flavin-nucleotide-binding protein
MGKRMSEIDERLRAFIERQRLFFVATAVRDGRVNISPKGMDTLRVLGPNRVAWLSVTGSGNETAAHLREQSRITLMFCAFEGDPMILRVYGNATVIHPHDARWQERVALFPPLPGARQVIDVAVDLVQTSCGMGVPFFAYRGEREQLNDWARKRGADGVRQYWRDRNRTSLDGKPTGILGDEA